MRRALVLVAAAGGALTAALALAAGSVAAGVAASPPIWKNGMFAAGTQQIVLTIHPARGTMPGVARPVPDEWVSRPNFAVMPGVPVKVTVTNYTGDGHSFTAPGLGVSFFIRPGQARAPSTTVFTFVPRERGVFHWYCALPCGEMGMSGNIYAIVGPTAL